MSVFYKFSVALMILVLAAQIVSLSNTLTSRGEETRRGRALVARSDLRVCEEVQSVKRDVRDWIIGESERGRKQLLAFAYYREHPEDLARARSLIDAQETRTRTKFAPKSCSTLPSQKLKTRKDG